MKPGKALESALGFACEIYKDRGIAKVQKVDASHIKGGIYIKSNGSDFQGYYGKPPVPIHFEAKETHKDYLSLDEKGLKESQRTQLQRSYDDGVTTGVVVAFLPLWEVFWLDWPVVAEFVANRWRESISQAFCRAYGEALLVDWSRTDKRPRVMWLERRPHALREQARAIVEREKAKFQPPLFEALPPKKRVKRAEPPRTADGKLDLIGGMRWGAKARGVK
jgi:penicillin-binding protein-related factor A (putative recombinase)